MKFRLSGCLLLAMASACSTFRGSVPEGYVLKPDPRGGVRLVKIDQKAAATPSRNDPAMRWGAPPAVVEPVAEPSATSSGNRTAAATGPHLATTKPVSQGGQHVADAADPVDQDATPAANSEATSPGASASESVGKPTGGGSSPRVATPAEPHVARVEDLTAQAKGRRETEPSGFGRPIAGDAHGSLGTAIQPVEGTALISMRRDDLNQRTQPRSALAGIYRLQFFTLAGKIIGGAEGYICFGDHHMLLYLTAPGVDPALPILRAGARMYRTDGSGNLLLRSLAGHVTDEDGDLYVEADNLALNVGYTLVGNTLRIQQSENSLLEFQRVE